jgi:CMP-N,N'-diacetyllegionaminic acid synthase
MYKGKKIAAIIPARGGSKGIPNKNIIDLNGMPLIAHSITEAMKSSYIDKVIVSTDSTKISEIARQYHAVVNGLRPEELSGDTSIIYDVLRYEIGNHSLVEEGYETLILLQPTSPLRRSNIIDEAIIRYVDENQVSAVSVSEVHEHPIFMRTIDESGRLSRVLDVASTVRRQELPKFYRVNGMIYINHIKDLLDGYVSLNDNISPIIIPQKYDIDIDTLEDLFEAEKRLKDLR